MFLCCWIVAEEWDDGMRGVDERVEGVESRYLYSFCLHSVMHMSAEYVRQTDSIDMC